MDRLTSDQRRRCMQGNRGKGTSIEVLLCRELWRRGLRYRKNDRTVVGSPDISFKGRKLAVFCDGDFWHGRGWEESHSKIKSNKAYWHAKIERNMAHDKEVNVALEQKGWKVLRYWESDIKKDVAKCADEVEQEWCRLEVRRIRRAYEFDSRFEGDVAAEGEEDYGIGD